MKKLYLLIAAVFAFSIFTIPAYAVEDYEYEMYDCWWEDQAEDGRIFGSWDKCDAKTSYKVRLTVGDNHKTVKSWFSSSSSGTCDFTQYIVAHGRGVYYFDVYPTKGGEGYMISSEGFEVTSDILSKAKKYIKKVDDEKKAAMRGWMKGPDGFWRYYKEGGVACKNEWLEDAGKWYHFTSDSKMQTGWQAIGDNWYYFDQSGALLVNGVSPDGYWVNGDGKWIDGNGNPVSVSASKTSSSSSSSSSSSGKKDATKTITEMNIRVSEKNKGAGVVMPAEFVAGTGFTITSETLSIPREQWSPGTLVTVTLHCVPKNGYVFSVGNEKVTIKDVSNIHESGSTTERTIVFSYKPKMKLTAPTGFAFDENMDLTWKKSESATSYKLVFYLNDSKNTTKTVSTNRLTDAEDYIYLGEGTVSVKVYAQSPENKSYLLESDAGVINDLSDLLDENTNGGFVWKGGTLYYLDATGEKLTGWQQIDGSWYHFKKSGAIDGPGWFKDTDGCWYWFDSSYKMCVGTINDGKANYFMNDGSNPNLPYGAWKE